MTSCSPSRRQTPHTSMCPLSDGRRHFKKLHPTRLNDSLACFDLNWLSSLALAWEPMIRAGGSGSPHNCACVARVWTVRR
eukprot:scaffold502856_cov32-Prasinocladus_malaysianus.AAC.1